MEAAVVLALAGCASDVAPAPPAPVAPPAAFDATPYVDPFIGTGGHGHTFPGATVPFGMVQLSPDTRLEGWDGCSGYHHDDEFIYGFSHTHLSGTGCSDYGDILLMPGVGEVKWKNGADGKPGYRSHFSHANETASAGYYSVVLDDSGVKAELTATTRVGVHRYTFPPGTNAGLLIDLAHRDEVVGSRVVHDGYGVEIRGMRRSKAWAQDQRVFFVARFSNPAKSITLARDGVPTSSLTADGKNVKAWLDFGVSDGRPLVVAVGISAVDEAGAAKNLDAECPGFDFDAVRDAARETWRRQLGKIEVRGGTDAHLRTFYTALYHCCIAPNVFSDVDGRYRGRDGDPLRATGWTQYTVFSLWDTFRALHPLMTILEPQRTNDWINTFVAGENRRFNLPVWELAANETNCMIGYHSVSVIADAYAKGIRGFDVERAWSAMFGTAYRRDHERPEYYEFGFVSSETEGESVSKTLEYAYDDWCVSEISRVVASTAKNAAIAAMAGRNVREFSARAQSWKNLFDPSTGFFRPRRNNAWIEPFDPAEVNNHFTEANAWQYSLFVPHDVEVLAAMLGGREKLAARLDALFTAPSATKGRDQADISGMIGQYAHGNEPSHHMAYLYDYCGEPWKTQQRVRQILDTLYSDKPDGLCGNEDCGQMSAWYVLSALGFYPVCPGRPEYVIGAPRFPEARLHLDGGTTFTIHAEGDGPYVRSATMNGAPLRTTLLPHAAIVAGGDLSFAMGSEPSRWGSDAAEIPRSRVEGAPVVPVPFVVGGERVFRDATDVALAVADPRAEIRVQQENREMNIVAFDDPYAGPIHVEATREIVFWAERDGRESKHARVPFVRQTHTWTLTLVHPYAPQYAADGPRTLIDGLRGGGDWRTGAWQGFQGDDVDAKIDLGVEREITAVRAGFMQDTGSWIWWPTEFVVSTSTDGKTFAPLGTVANTSDEHATATQALVFEVPKRVRARYVRVVAKNRGACPAWHPGAGHKAWLFADEIGVDVVE